MSGLGSFLTGFARGGHAAEKQRHNRELLDLEREKFKASRSEISGPDSRNLPRAHRPPPPRGGSDPYQMDETELLARTLMGEAGQEGEHGMLAAGAVIDNRRRAGNYGGSQYRDVIMKPGQFSLWNGVTGYAGGKGANDAWRGEIDPVALSVAQRITSGNYKDPTGGATHYYAPAAADPVWARGKPYQTIGNHRFLRANAGETRSLKTTAKPKARPSNWVDRWVEQENTQ